MGNGNVSRRVCARSYLAAMRCHHPDPCLAVKCSLQHRPRPSWTPGSYAIHIISGRAFRTRRSGNRPCGPLNGVLSNPLGFDLVRNRLMHVQPIAKKKDNIRTTNLQMSYKTSLGVGTAPCSRSAPNFPSSSRCIERTDKFKHRVSRTNCLT